MRVYDPEAMTGEQQQAVAAWLHPRFAWGRRVVRHPVRVLGPVAFYRVYVTDRYGRVKTHGPRAVTCPLVAWVGRTRPQGVEG